MKTREKVDRFFVGWNSFWRNLGPNLVQLFGIFPLILWLIICEFFPIVWRLGIVVLVVWFGGHLFHFW